MVYSCIFHLVQSVARNCFARTKDHHDAKIQGTFKNLCTTAAVMAKIHILIRVHPKSPPIFIRSQADSTPNPELSESHEIYGYGNLLLVLFLVLFLVLWQSRPFLVPHISQKVTAAPLSCRFTVSFQARSHRQLTLGHWARTPPGETVRGTPRSARKKTRVGEVGGVEFSTFLLSFFQVGGL